MQEMAGEPSKAALGWVVDTEQWQEGLKQEYRLSVKMALLQGKLLTNRLILISWNIQPGYYMLEFTFWQRQLLSLKTLLFWWWNNTRKFKLHYIFHVLSLLNIQSTNCAHIFKPPEIATASLVWETSMRNITFQQVKLVWSNPSKRYQPRWSDATFRINLLGIRKYCPIKQILTISGIKYFSFSSAFVGKVVFGRYLKTELDKALQKIKNWKSQMNTLAFSPS